MYGLLPDFINTHSHVEAFDLMIPKLTKPKAFYETLFIKDDAHVTPHVTMYNRS